MTVPLVIRTSSPATFEFQRTGGAVVHARLSIWTAVGTPNEKKAAVLFFEDSAGPIPAQTQALARGLYQCVLTVFIREDLNGVYTYQLLASTRVAAADSGDVNSSPSPDDGAINRHEFVLQIA